MPFRSSGASENSYEAGKYTITGNEIGEQFMDMQADDFAFVADQDKVVTVEFVIEAGLDEWMEQSEVSGIAKFVGAGLANTPLAPESKMRTRAVSMTGMVIEAGIRNYYVIHENSMTENFSAAVKRVTAEAIDDYAGNRAAIQINAEIRVSDPLEVVGE